MTRHDDHYAKMAIQPIEVMEQVAANAKDPIAGLRVAMACKYLLRAGTKDGWAKDLEKASNYLYRALHGVWPWDAVEDDGAHPPHRHCGCVECEKSFPENCDGSPNVPPRDSGEELVGRECYACGTGGEDDAARGVISEVIDYKDRKQYAGREKSGYRFFRSHAQPVELGHPSPDHPEYRRER